MKISNPSTAIFVKDINVSKQFYHGLLGMPVELDFGKNVMFRSGFAIWEIQPSHIIPKTLGADNTSKSKICRFEIYFETDDLMEVFHVLKAESVTFLHEIHDEPWGQKTIRFFDPDGHLVEIGESLKVFVCRFHDQGMSPEQVSARTSVPVDEVKRLIGSI